MQVTMLLGKGGWRRLYSAESIIQTAGPVTLDGWVGQRVSNPDHYFSSVA